MNDVAPPAIAAPLAPATPAQRAKIRDSAQKFEGQFLSIMMQQMFAGVKVEEPFGGGPGEDMFKSFMTEAMSKQIAQSGGVGIADSVAREMLKLQGLQ